MLANSLPAWALNGTDPPNLRLLPKSEWRVVRFNGGPYKDTHIGLSAWLNGEHVHWKRVALAELPNDMISQADIDRLAAPLAEHGRVWFVDGSNAGYVSEH